MLTSDRLAGSASWDSDRATRQPDTSDSATADSATRDSGMERDAATGDRLLSVAEVARRTGRSERTIQRYVRRGRLPAVTGPTGVFRIPERALVSVDATADSGEFDLSPTATQQVDAATRQAADRATGHATADIPLSRQVTVDALLPRYEAAVMRVGWLEGQLEMAQRMLGDGGQREAELRAEVEAAKARAEEEASEARVRAERAEREALEEQLRRQRVEADLAAAQQRLAELEAAKAEPWWKRWLK